ncbi:MAG: membrane protein insertase YidC [Bacteroidales bacterium]
MDKNTLFGMLAIGAILFGFSYYNTKQNEQYRLEKHRLDSIALQQKNNSIPVEPISTEPQTLKLESQSASIVLQPTQEEEFYTIENDVLEVTLSNKAGRIYSVNLKDYKSYNGEKLLLFDGANNRFSCQFYTNDSRNFETSQLYFTPQTEIRHQVLSDGDSVLNFVMRLQVSDIQIVDYIYTLRPNSYMIDFSIKTMGVHNVTNADLYWSHDVFQHEKAFDNENNYSTIAYNYPNETSMEELSIGTSSEKESVKTRLHWVAFKQQFFSSILIAKDDMLGGAELTYSTYKPNNNARYLKNYSASITLPIVPQRDINLPMAFYFGPNHYSTLKSFDANLDKLVPMGTWIIGWINRFLVIPIFDFLGKYIGSYGLIILILTIIIKLLLFPLTFKSYSSSAKMRLLKPDIDKIAKKYPKKEDAMKKQQETMAFYKKAGVSPMGGCLPIFIQLPILIAMFRFFPASIELRQQSFLWADDLSGFDSILNLPFNVPFYGDHISLFTLLMAITLFVSSRMSMSQTPDTGMPGMKFMTLYMMPVMMLFWFNSYAAGLSYYYFLSNLITIAQNYVSRSLVSDEKLHERMRQNSKKPVKKSRFQAKLEEMARMQQQRAKK